MVNHRRARGQSVLWAVTRALAALVLITSGAFIALALLPTDAADVTAGADRQRADALRQERGLTEPVWYRLGLWWGRAVTGDFGVSWASGRPAWQVVSEAAVRTAALAVPVLVAAAVVGTVAAVLIAWWKHRVPSQVLSAGVNLTVGAPEAVWVVLCVAWLATAWVGLPAVSVLPPGVEPWHEPVVLVLPMVALWVPASGWVARMLLGLAQDVVARQVVVSARRRGVPSVRVLATLVVPAVVRVGLPVYAMVGVGVLGGSVVVESLLAYPGLGSVVLVASATRDVPVVMVALLLATVVALGLLLCAGWGQQGRSGQLPAVRDGV